MLAFDRLHANFTDQNEVPHLLTWKIQNKSILKKHEELITKTLQYVDVKLNSSFLLIDLAVHWYTTLVFKQVALVHDTRSNDSCSYDNSQYKEKKKYKHDLQRLDFLGEKTGVGCIL